MKRLFVISLAFVLVSCSKQMIIDQPEGPIKKTLEMSFDVNEQQNVAQYIVEVSDDGGKTFNAAGSIASDLKTETSYSVRVDVSKYKLPMLARLISVDIDHKTTEYETVSVR